MQSHLLKNAVLGNFVGYNYQFPGFGQAAKRSRFATAKASTELSFESLLLREKMRKASSWFWPWLWNISCFKLTKQTNTVVTVVDFFAFTHRAFNYHAVWPHRRSS